MFLTQSKKTRAVAAAAAVSAFLGTLGVFAHGATSDEPTTRKYVIVSTRDECVDYHIGEEIDVPVAETPDEVIEVDLGGANDDIIAVLVD